MALGVCGQSGYLIQCIEGQTPLGYLVSSEAVDTFFGFDPDLFQQVFLWVVGSWALGLGLGILINVVRKLK